MTKSIVTFPVCPAHRLAIFIRLSRARKKTSVPNAESLLFPSALQRASSCRQGRQVKATGPRYFENVVNDHIAVLAASSQPSKRVGEQL